MSEQTPDGQTNETPAAKKAQTALANRKLALEGPVNNQGSRATFKIELWEQNPRFVVYTNDNSTKTQDNPTGKISAATSLTMYNAIMNKLIEIGKNPIPGTKAPFFFKHHPKIDGKASEVEQVTAKLIIGVDQAGIVSVSLIDLINTQMPKIVFQIALDSYHAITDGNGNAEDAAKASSMCAVAWAETMKTVVNTIVATTAYETTRQPFQKNNNSGGGNFNRNNRGNNGGGGGGYQRNNNWNKSGGNGGGGGYNRGGGGYQRNSAGGGGSWNKSGGNNGGGNNWRGNEESSSSSDADDDMPF